MRVVPFATPQTFSRIVVLPAFARPMIRIRKLGHLARSLSKAAIPLSATSVGSVESDPAVEIESAF